MTIGSYPIGVAPVGGRPAADDTPPVFPPPLNVTVWDAVASGPGMILYNGGRLAEGDETAIGTSTQDVDYVGEIIAEVDFTIDPTDSWPTYFGFATDAADTSLLCGGDVNSWAVKVAWAGTSGSDHLVDISYRHNGIDTFLGTWQFFEPDLQDPLFFFCTFRIGAGYIECRVGRENADVWFGGPALHVETGTDNLQPGDRCAMICAGTNLVYINCDKPENFVNADHEYPAGVYWDSVGIAGIIVLAPFVMPLEFAVPTSYQFNIPLVNAFIAPLDIPIEFAPFVQSDLVAPLVFAAESFLFAPLGDGIPADSNLVMPIDYGNPAAGSILAMPLTMVVDSALIMPITESAPTSSTLVMQIGYGDPVAAQIVFPITDMVNVPVESRAVLPLPILGEPPTIITDQPALYLGNKRIEIASAEIHSDDGSPFWQASIALASPSDYGRFPRDTAITLDLHGTPYEMIVDTRQLSRGMSPDGVPGDQASITALSPGARYGSPRALTFEQSWTTSTAASAAAAESLGVAIDWQMVDWIIPGFRLAVSGATPLDAAKQIIEAAGGLLLSRPDGSFIAQPEFPASAAAFDSAPVAATLSEFDIFVAVETIAPDAVINRVRVVDVEATYSDRLEFAADDDNPLRGIVRSYPSPWTDSVTFRDTAGLPVRVYAGAVESRQETETIEIQAGRGTVRYPITTIDYVNYVADDLGGVSFEPGTADVYTATADWSLLEITYTTRSIAAVAESDITTQAQILLEREI